MESEKGDGVKPGSGPADQSPAGSAGEAGKKAVDITPLATVPPGDADASGVVSPGPESSPELIEVTDITWESTVEKGKVPVAVMFYSPTCAFCHQMEPYFREFARTLKGSVLFARLNILTSTWTPERYGVRSTPTFKFFCDGKPVQEIVGAVYPAILKRIIDDVLVHGKECAKNSTAIDYEITGYG